MARVLLALVICQLQLQSDGYVFMDAKEIAKFAFFALAILSGVLWNLCKEECGQDKKIMYSPVWFMEGEKFSDRGNKLRRVFIVVSSLAMIDVLVWASL